MLKELREEIKVCKEATKGLDSEVVGKLRHCKWMRTTPKPKTTGQLTKNGACIAWVTDNRHEQKLRLNGRQCWNNDCWYFNHGERARGVRRSQNFRGWANMNRCVRQQTTRRGGSVPTERNLKSNEYLETKTKKKEKTKQNWSRKKKNPRDYVHRQKTLK